MTTPQYKSASRDLISMTADLTLLRGIDYVEYAAHLAESLRITPYDSLYLAAAREKDLLFYTSDTLLEKAARGFVSIKLLPP